MMTLACILKIRRVLQIRGYCINALYALAIKGQSIINMYFIILFVSFTLRN
jgi:hypothetical protein